MNKVYYVYGYFCPDTGVPLYIGKGTRNRMLKHVDLANNYTNYNNNRWIHKLKKMLAVNKMPIITKLAQNLNEKEAYDLEGWLISSYGRKKIDKNGLLYNLIDANGKWPRRKVSDETRKKMSEKSLGRPLSAESRKKISIANKGRIVSKEVKEKISNSLKGKIMPARSKDWSIKQRASHLGRKDPITAFDNKSKAQSGANNPRSKTWNLQIEDGSILIIESLKTWCKENNINLYKLRKTLDNNTSYNNMKLISRVA